MILEQTASGILCDTGPHAGEWRIGADVYLTDAELAEFDNWPTYADCCDPDRRHEPGGMCWCGRLHNAAYCERLNRLERRTQPSRPLQSPVPADELLGHIAVDHEALRRVWGLAHRWAEQAMLHPDPNGVLASATRLHAEMACAAVTGQPSEPRQLGSLLAGLAAARLQAEDTMPARAPRPLSEILAEDGTAMTRDLEALVTCCRAALWDSDAVADLLTQWLDAHGFDLGRPADPRGDIEMGPGFDPRPITGEGGGSDDAPRP